MQQFLGNKYVQLGVLTLGIGALFFAVLWIVFGVIGLKDFPVTLEAVLAILAAGILVYKFFAQKLF